MRASGISHRRCAPRALDLEERISASIGKQTNKQTNRCFHQEPLVTETAFIYMSLTLNDLYNCVEVLRGGEVGGSQVSPEFLKGRG